MIQALATAPIPEQALALVRGRARDEVTTPALVLDLDVARANIERMGARMRGLPTSLRPHVKVHKSPELARLQVAAGAIGVTTATVWEARAMIDGGIGEVLVANQLVGRAQVAAAAELAGRARLLVAVDDARNLRDLGRAAEAAGSEIGVLVEVDTGMGRCGVASADDAARLASVAAATPGIALAGVCGYEGHCMMEPDPEARAAKAAAATAELVAAADALIAAGLPCEVVSAGGTGTFELTGADPRVTEIQAGSYVLMDAFHDSLVPDRFDLALTVLATVISRSGDRVVVDAGRKAILDEMAPPRIAGTAIEASFVNEEHSGFEGVDLDVGDRVALVPGYAPSTVNLHGIYHVVENGVVTDLWPVTARYGVASLA